MWNTCIISPCCISALLKYDSVCTDAMANYTVCWVACQCIAIEVLIVTPWYKKGHEETREGVLCGLCRKGRPSDCHSFGAYNLFSQGAVLPGELNTFLLSGAKSKEGSAGSSVWSLPDICCEYINIQRLSKCSLACVSAVMPRRLGVLKNTLVGTGKKADCRHVVDLQQNWRQTGMLWWLESFDSEPHQNI